MVEYEVVANEKIRHLHILVNEISFRPSHVHNEAEILFALSGKGSLTVNKETLSISEGDIAVVNSSQTHEIRSEEKLTFLIIQISSYFLNDYYPKLRNIRFLKNLIARDDPAYPEIRDLLLRIGNIYFHAEEHYELSCVGLLCQLIGIILDQIPYQVMSEREFGRMVRNQKRIDRITSYIDENYQGPIRLKDIAENEKITITHLSHLIKDTYGMGFQEYLNYIRFQHSLRLLGNKSLSLTDIAFESGFSDIKYLNQMYLNTFHKTPKQMRSSLPEEIPSREKSAITLENILDRDQSIEVLSGIISQKQERCGLFRE